MFLGNLPVDFGDYRDFVNVRTREVIEANNLTEGQVMTMTKAELMKLKGAGKVTVQDILAYREWRKVRPTIETKAMVMCRLLVCKHCHYSYWQPCIPAELGGGGSRCPHCGK